MSNGILYQDKYRPNTDYKLIYSEGYNLTDYEVAVDAWSNGWYHCCSAIILLFRYQDDNNFYWIQPHSYGRVILYSTVNCVRQTLTSYEVGYSQIREKARYRVVVNGNLITVYRNSELIISYNDDSLSSGTVAFQSIHIPGYFDNFELNSLTPPNQPPVIEGPDNLDIVENHNLTAHYTVYDPDNNLRYVDTTGMPDGFSFTAVSENQYLLSWTPGLTESGLYNLKISAEDMEGDITEMEVSINVEDFNVCDQVNEITCYISDIIPSIYFGDTPSKQNNNIQYLNKKLEDICTHYSAGREKTAENLADTLLSHCDTANINGSIEDNIIQPGEYQEELFNQIITLIENIILASK